MAAGQAGAVAQHQGNGTSTAGSGDDLDLLVQHDAIGGELRPHYRDGVGIIIGQDRSDIDQRHLDAQPRESLSQFAADDTAANDEQVVGRFDKIEYGLVGMTRQCRQSWNRRNRRV